MRRFLVGLWVFPANLLMIAYLAPLVALRWVERRGRVAGVAVYSVKPGTWYARRWRGWGGFAGPSWILINPASYRGRDVLIAHELRHVAQWRAWGALFPLVYLVGLAAFGYRDHPLEVDARAAEIEGR